MDSDTMENKVGCDYILQTEANKEYAAAAAEGVDQVED